MHFLCLKIFFYKEVRCGFMKVALVWFNNEWFYESFSQVILPKFSL